jgi:hypothetical protein
MTLEKGSVGRQERFRTHAYVEEAPLPAVRAPREREICLQQLATLAEAC